MTELKHKLEALLFSSGRKMSIEEFSKICKAAPSDIKGTLEELRAEYEKKESSLMIVEEGGFWKLTTKEPYLDVVKKIVTETELTKSLMETLAVIAFKYPVLQSDVIKIRTNKAYEHLKELEDMGYITRQKHGRTNLIKLTDKFFSYFSLTKEQLNEKFKDFDSIAKEIEKKEDDIEKAKTEYGEKAKQAKEHKEKLGQLVIVDEDEMPKEEPKIVEEKEMLGPLEVVDEPEEQEPSETGEEPEEEPQTGGEESQEEPEEGTEKLPEEPEASKSAEDEEEPEEDSEEKQAHEEKSSPEIEKRVQRRVEEIFHPPKESEEAQEESYIEDQEQSEEPAEKEPEQASEGFEDTEEKEPQDENEEQEPEEELKKLPEEPEASKSAEDEEEPEEDELDLEEDSEGSEKKKE